VLGELIERWRDGAPDDPSTQRFAELRDDIEKIKTRVIVRAISELAEMSSVIRMNTRSWRRNCGRSWKPVRINYAEQPQRQQTLRTLMPHGVRVR
jgi:hypothetical protein